jgi:hypothetical protein
VLFSNRIAGRIFPSTHIVDSYDKCTSFVSCLLLPLIVWVGRVMIDTIPDDVLLIIFYHGLEESMKMSIDCIPQSPEAKRESCLV